MCLFVCLLVCLRMIAGMIVIKQQHVARGTNARTPLISFRVVRQVCVCMCVCAIGFGKPAFIHFCQR